MELSVEIENVSGDDEVPPPAEIEQWVLAALGSRLSEAELSIRIVDETQISELNSTYRHKQGPTNVLSFPAELPEHITIPLLGDLAICAPVVEREALEQGKPLHAHWAHMVIHGTLHLLGYDHIEENDAELMEGIEIDILAALNISNPYQPTATTIAPCGGKHPKL